MSFILYSPYSIALEIYSKYERTYCLSKSDLDLIICEDNYHIAPNLNPLIFVIYSEFEVLSLSLEL